MYIVKGYRTHENEQYGRSEELFKSDSLQACTLFAKNHITRTRDYQVNVYNDKTKKLVYSNRCGVEYKFVSRDASTFEELTKISNRLLHALKLAELVESEYTRLCLYEENGVIIIKNEMLNKVVVDDVFGGYCSNRIAYYVERLVMLFDSIFPKGVKKYTFILESGDLSYYYFTDSKEERGSLEVYLDWF